jgi:hypothetical protein
MSAGDFRCWQETVMPVLSPQVRYEGMNGPSSVAVRGPSLTQLGHRAKLFYSGSPAPFEKSVEDWRRKGAAPQPLRDVRLRGDQCE